MNEKYMFAKNLVRQKYSYMSNIENLLILGIYGLLSVYNNYQKIIPDKPWIHRANKRCKQQNNKQFLWKIKNRHFFSKI